MTVDSRPVLPLLDRDEELVVLQQAVDEAAAGEGRVVLVEGGPGVGKTRLLAAARMQCEQAGVRVLGARGGEIEREHPYGIARQLFEEALLGPEQAAWLQGPAAGAASVFWPESAEEAAPFMTLRALYWLTTNAAGERPTALLVDDLHWADTPSVHFLEYLARRLDGTPVLLVLAGRPRETDLLTDLAADPATSLLRPAPLTQPAAARLTRELLGVPPAERFAEASWRSTGGNPLLLVELLRALRAEGVVPDDAHVGEVDNLGPSAIARSVLVRLRRLPAEALAVAQAVALLGSGAETSLLGELAGVDEDAVVRSVASLVAAEIIDPQPPLTFTHPIVRDAVYRELPPDQRDRRHGRAAELLHARAANAHQAGAHLLLTSPRGSRWVVSTLQQAAADAARRGAVETAVTFLRRALAERPGETDFDLLYRLGLTEAAVDPAAAAAHLEAALRATTDAPTRARLGELIARLLVFVDPPGAIAAARRAREDRTDEDPADATAALVALERYAARFGGAEVAVPTGAVPPTASGRTLTAVRAWELALDGGPADDAAALAAQALLLDEPGGAEQVFTRSPLFTAMIASSVLLLADDPRAEGFWETWQVEAVRAGRAHALIAGDVWRGWLQLRLGRLEAAEASLRTALEGPGTWGPGTESPPVQALSLLAQVLLERGDLDGARVALDRVPADARADTEGVLLCRCAELRLLVAQGRHHEVPAVAEGVGGRLRTVRNPAWAPWRSALAEALAALGRRDEALELAREELELARGWGTPAPVARALTALGTLAERPDLLEEAVAIADGPFARLERAAALLALGGAVRRGRRPADARALLREAHDVAEDCGAEGIALRARQELAVAGGRPRPTPGSGADALTPSERRVAELAAAGRRNQEIAGLLHLSTKTIEVHLSSSYRKLGIRRRSELAAVLETTETGGR